MGSVDARTEKVIAMILRLIVGGVFIYAGALKALDPAQFAVDVDNFRLLPYPLACAMGVYLPWLEIVCGAALAFGIFRPGATLLLAGILIGFLIALVTAWARGLDIHCGCFGHSSGKSHLWASVLLDVALLGAVCLISKTSSRTEGRRQLRNR